MSLDKAYRFTLKPEKLLLNPEGCSYRRLCKQGNEGRKKEENSEQQALKSKKLILTRARSHSCTAEAHHLTGGCANVSHSLNKTSYLTSN